MNILGAPTNLGLKPYDEDGTPRGNRQAPRRLRQHGIVERLAARDLGDVVAADYRDLVRPRRAVRNEDLVLDHAERIASAIAASDDFTLLLGGDCSILLGSLLGNRRRHGEIGLVFIDGHSDFNTPATSETGGAAGMDLALVTGRGNTPLARLIEGGPLVRQENVVTIGIRDDDLSHTRIRSASSADEALALLGERPFFVHLDIDVLDPRFMPFVDEPVSGGFDPDSLAGLLSDLVSDERAVGMEVTIYDPRQDPRGEGAALIVNILETAFTSRADAARSSS